MLSNFKLQICILYVKILKLNNFIIFFNIYKLTSLLVLYYYEHVYKTILNSVGIFI